MNLPITEDLRERFSVVLDSGSLEHVFNFPTAIKNCMEMVRPGGHFLGITPCNNFMGHGFYQFSPELFFRIFSDQNGFAMERMMLFESTPMARWYVVLDPEELGKRTELLTRRNTFLLIQARRTAIKQIFAMPPQQSDYAALWRENQRAANNGLGPAVASPTLITRIKKALPRSLKRGFWSLMEFAKPRLHSESLREIRLPESN
jgi:SAM-dependent methyltransferase